MSSESSSSRAAHAPVWSLALGALGIVYGDIGTSPLYAMRECFLGDHGVLPTQANVLGVLSLMFWSLLIVVSVKYLAFIMRADNHGEGGVFALLALAPLSEAGTRRTRALVLLALFGAALLYGDGIITPSISVLSAVEGLGLAAPSLRGNWVVLLTVAILVSLFMAQRRGTGGLGRVFGWVMLVWFVAIAAWGLRYVLRQPQVLAALNPWHGALFFRHNGAQGFLVLGSVVLCITGAEALYADMGHFGRRPIRQSWFCLVLPSLLLSYFGLGALLLEEPPGSVENPFYDIVPTSMLYPMVGLATLAAVIASQALISGAFSLTRQAIQLGYCPRLTIIHTSGEHEGQIYLPEVNRILMVACVFLVLAFQESSRLAAAYGIAVTGTMAITSVLYFGVVRRRWKWPRWQALPLVGLFLFCDLSYFGANLLKFFDGGWFPVVMAAGIFTLMATWKTGRFELAARFMKTAVPLEVFLEDIKRSQPHRVVGTAVFMASNSTGTPPVLLHHLKHNQVLHQQVVLLTIDSATQPVVPPEERLHVEDLGEGFYRVMARYGFMQSPSVPEVMRAVRKRGVKTEPARTSFYLGRDTLLTSGRSQMSRWRKVLFSFIARNARSPTSYFNIPPGRVVELGMQIDL